MRSVGPEARSRPSFASAIVATAVMIGSLATAWWLTPTRSWYDALGRPNLEQVVPTQFGDWVASDKAPVLMVNPELSEMLHVVYAQTLSRTYKNRASGHIVMLSIALGLDQSHATQLHHPEGCYRTQGFVIDETRDDVLRSPVGPIKLSRFLSHAGTRREPVSYWIRIGKWTTRGWLDVNLSRLTLALRGYNADGLLFRASEISGDSASSFRVQDEFMNDLLRAVPPGQLRFLVGSPAT